MKKSSSKKVLKNEYVEVRTMQTAVVIVVIVILFNMTHLQ